MNEIQIFNNEEFGQIRTLTINGEPWITGKDVARALGYGEGKSLTDSMPVFNGNAEKFEDSANEHEAAVL